MKTSPINPGDKTGKPHMTREQYDAAVHAKVEELEAWHKETGIELVMCFGRPGNENREAHLAHTVELPDVVRVLSQMLERTYGELCGGVEVSVKLELK